MSFLSVLPKPKHSVTTSKWAQDPEPEPIKKKKSHIPPYGKRQDFIPQTQKDFGDGGAFPEIHIVQYPLDMGKNKSMGAETSETLPLQSDESGQVRYDLVLRKGTNYADNKVIHGTVNSLMAKDYDIVPPRAAPEELEETRKDTLEALNKIIEGRIASGRPKDVKTETGGPSFVKYVPAKPNDDGTGASSRIIRIAEAPVDPLEPPRFKHRKIPRSTGSPPPPVLRSPPRKVSVEEQKNWVIPPCISNWKNAKGYTIPLDKRLANDGRGLQDVTINDNFSKLSEALFIADRHAREEVKLRAEMQSKLALKQKKEKEEKLRMLAQQAREERAGFASGADALQGAISHSESSESEEEMTAEELARLKEREELRKERARQREKELRLSQLGKDTKKSDRDISEKIALGLAQPTISAEGMFDQRLFNQTSGLSSGFGDDDSYNLYDKALFNGSSANAIYRPKKGQEDFAEGVSKEKITGLLNQPHRGFSGADSSEAIRSGPVLFEKEADVFGTDAFMSAAKRGRSEAETSSTKKSRTDK